VRTRCSVAEIFRLHPLDLAVAFDDDRQVLSLVAKHGLADPAPRGPRHVRAVFTSEILERGGAFSNDNPRVVTGDAWCIDPHGGIHPASDNVLAFRQRHLFGLPPLRGSAGVKVESSAMKVDGRREVRRVAKATGLALDAHDPAIDAFGHAVGNRVLGKAEHAFEMALEHGRRPFQRLEPRVDGPGVPP